MDIHKETYRQEAFELLSELESSLLELEEKPHDEDLIGRIFRAMHTIKGSGAMFGFEELADFTHKIETVFDMVRNGEIEVTKEIIDLSLKARDHMKSMILSETGEDAKTGEDIVKALWILIPGDKEKDKPKREMEMEIPESPSSAELTYRIRFKPSADIFQYGTNPVLLLKELSSLGECSVLAHTFDIPHLDKIDPESCYTKWDIILSTSKGINAIKEIFIFVENNSELDIEQIGNTGQEKKIGEIIVDRGYLSEETLENILDRQRPIGEMLIQADVVDRHAIDSALVEQEHFREVHRKQQNSALSSSVRVTADKLDTLVNLVGELVTVQARLNRASSNHKDPELNAISEEVERLTGELRDNTMSIRMLPLETIFSKFKRLVRDLSIELEKETVLSIRGGETELDKTVIERLDDPLVHIIRNCIDHGIESPGIREESGKPARGTVTLSAAHAGADVLLKISDDGAGLDLDQIRSIALEKGLIETDTSLSEEKLFELVFAPGFSTTDKVTDVSGRGVGMDVVKRAIEALRGSVEISSEKGIGTTITLKLPLTLAIIDGLLVKIGDSRFVIPLSSVEECVELDNDQASKARDRNMMNLRDQIIPYLNLRELFLIDGEVPANEPVVIAKIRNDRIGIGVDRVIGQNQTVLKPLGNFYKNITGISGATIMGDGAVALILDIFRLVREYEK